MEHSPEKIPFIVIILCNDDSINLGAKISLLKVHTAPDVMISCAIFAHFQKKLNQQFLLTPVSLTLAMTMLMTTLIMTLTMNDTGDDTDNE